MRCAMVRDRPMMVALAVSAAFHLSMVTLFSIVIKFPVPRVQYYRFEIVDPRTRQPIVPSDRRSSLFPPIGEVLGGEGAATAEDPWQGLPKIELPTLAFTELDQLRAREEGLRVRSRYAELLSIHPQESWRGLGKELRQVRDALTRLPFLEQPTQEEEDRPQPIARPAEGFEAYIEWMTAPRDRELLFAPPIEALWGVKPEELAAPITLVFKVNPEGKVTEVFMPVEDTAGIVAGAAKALARYRFKPLEQAAPREQRATLIIAAERTRHD